MVGQILLRQVLCAVYQTLIQQYLSLIWISHSLSEIPPHLSPSLSVRAKWLINVTD